MNNPSSRRIAAVTGAAGGIGGGIVLALAERGFDVVACDRAFSPATEHRLRSQLAAPARLALVEGDLADQAGHGALVDAIYAAFGRVDCLVNNAGVSALSRGDLLDVTPESYDLNFSVNTRAGFFLTQAIARRMLAGGTGSAEAVESRRSVIFISSSNAAIAAPERGEYAMSKAAVSMMSKLFAVRLAPHGIAVYEVRPGLIQTAMTAVAQQRFDALLATGFTPFNRWGQPGDVGRAVATMAAGDLPFTTGTAIEVDGGMHIHQY